MVDTIRTLAELNGLFADNNTQSVSEQDLRDLVLSQNVHAEIGSGAKTLITLGTGWQALDFDVAGAFERGVTANTVDSRIEGVPCTMKAVVTVEVFFKGEVGQDYDFTVFRNTHSTPAQINTLNRLGMRVLDAAQTIQHSWSVGVQFSAGDSIQAAVRSNGNDFELLFGLLRFQRIGVE